MENEENTTESETENWRELSLLVFPPTRKLGTRSPLWQTDSAISPIYNELHLRRAAPYLGVIESELLSLNKIARILYDNQRTVLQRTDIREWVHYTNLTKN